MAGLKERVVLSNTNFRLIELGGQQFIDVREEKHCKYRDLLYSYLSNALDYGELDTYMRRYPVELLVSNRSVLGKAFLTGALGKILDGHTAVREKLMKQRLANGTVELDDIVKIFPVGTEVIIPEDNPVGGVVQLINVRRSWFGLSLEVRLKVVHAMSGNLEEGIYHATLPGFNGLKKIDDIGIRKLTDEERESLQERGANYIKLCRPGTYVSYQGNIEQLGFWSARSFRADGRVVIDPVSLARLEPEIWRNLQQNSGIAIEEREQRLAKAQQTVPESEYWRCVPYLYGFSMRAKQWGRLNAQAMSDVQFREEAFSTLVLETDTKHLIHSLVKHHGGGFSDIIEDKGGGCIFLLHGEPGLGKTATAEAVAEEARKPLYSVSVGELGTNTKALEDSLRNILEVATIWDAVVLLDEADIFLEERDSHNIERNAMVGVFLRLLEYHNGILFLTTNRVTKIDKAFYSRISVAVHYKASSVEKRRAIWHNLLGAANMPQDWAELLSVHDVNGRQIKNSIRLSQTLARARQDDVRLEDVEESIQAALEFVDEMHMKSADDLELVT